MAATALPPEGLDGVSWEVWTKAARDLRARFAEQARLSRDVALDAIAAIQAIAADGEASVGITRLAPGPAEIARVEDGLLSGFDLPVGDEVGSDRCRQADPSDRAIATGGGAQATPQAPPGSRRIARRRFHPRARRQLLDRGLTMSIGDDGPGGTGAAPRPSSSFSIAGPDAGGPGIAGTLRSSYLGFVRDRNLDLALRRGFDELAVRRRDGSRAEGESVVILGESGAGKSECIRLALARLARPDAEGVVGPVLAVSVVCTGSSTLRILGEAILEKCHHVIRGGLREKEIWRQVRIHLQLHEIRVVHIDEVGNLVETANATDRQRIVNTMKALINNPDWPVVLVLSGTPAIAPALREDRQRTRRLTWISMNALRAPKNNVTLARFAASLCAKAAIASDPTFEEAIAPCLVHAAGRQVGLAADMSTRTVLNALDEERPATIPSSPRIGSRPIPSSRWTCAPAREPTRIAKERRPARSGGRRRRGGG